MLDKYDIKNKQPSYASARRFSKLDEGKSSRKESDTGSEDGILPIERTRDAILKQVSYSVKVSDMEKGVESGRSMSVIGQHGRMDDWEHE